MILSEPQAPLLFISGRADHLMPPSIQRSNAKHWNDDVISGGAVNDTEVHFAKPGKYLLACFFSEGQHRKPHSARGMVRAVTVR